MKFASSQVLTPPTLNKPHMYLRSQRWTKPLLLPWKFQRTPTKMVAKERRLKLSRAWIKVKTRRKILLIPQRKSQILLPLSSAKLLTQWFPRQKLRIGDFFYFYMFSIAVFLFKECIRISLLSMMVFFFFKVCIMGFTIIVCWYIIILL